MKQCQPKVAICISGAVRGNFKVCFDSIYDKLVKPLDADVFIHTDNYPFERSVNICGKQYREYIKERLKVFADACHKKHGITK